MKIILTLLVLPLAMSLACMTRVAAAGEGVQNATYFSPGVQFGWKFGKRGKGGFAGIQLTVGKIYDGFYIAGVTAGSRFDLKNRSWTLLTDIQGGTTLFGGGVGLSIRPSQRTVGNRVGYRMKTWGGALLLGTFDGEYFARGDLNGYGGLMLVLPVIDNIGGDFGSCCHAL